MRFRYGALFDMDGVIVDNSEYHILAFEEWCREKGAEFDRDSFRKHLFGKQNKDIFIALLGKEFSPEELMIEDEYKEFLYRKVYANHLKAMDGLVDFLHDLKRSGFGLAVATSGPPENVNFVMEGIGADGLFDVMVTSKDVSVGKPNPQVFLKAAEGLGMPPEMCAVFEDSPAGAQAAIASGAMLIGVSTGHTQLENASRMIDDFTEIDASQVMELIDKSAVKTRA